MQHDTDMDIDTLLRTQLDLPMDDGFCGQIMASLPSRRARHAWVLPAGAFSGALLAAACVVALGLPLAAVMCAAAGMSLLAALWALCEADKKASSPPGRLDDASRWQNCS